VQYQRRCDAGISSNSDLPRCQICKTKREPVEITISTGSLLLFLINTLQKYHDFPATVSIILLNYFFGRNLEKFSPFLKIF
jgi:hypothetical protein